MTDNLQQWLDHMSPEALLSLKTCLGAVKEMREKGQTVYPQQNDILKALEMTGPNDTKCVIIGQDPYHGPNQACGLSFSVPSGVTPPPSLKNIFSELNYEFGFEEPTSGDLTPWARQHVMLLNASLTVLRGLPNSHANLGWHDVTSDIVRITLESSKPCVYLLWGRYAQNMVKDVAAQNRDKLSQIDTSNKLFVLTSHPSPYSADKAGRDFCAFKRSYCFKTCNQFLERHGETPIDWRLP